MTDKRSGRRVLLLNPGKTGHFQVTRAHIGFGILAAVLHQHGHTVRIVDYAFLKGVGAPVPRVDDVIRDFRPDLIGISVFTFLHSEALAMVEAVAHFPEIPVILGGPHITMFPNDFTADRRISYLVTGEAELVLPNLIARASRQEAPVRVEGVPPNTTEIPAGRLDDFDGIERLREFQVQLSRGCPYHCAFCAICRMAGRSVRARNLDACLHEISEVLARHPQISLVTITDDCPTFDPPRFKTFLRRFAALKTGRTLSIANMRARDVDEEFVALYSAAGGRDICVGVESGDPEVFARVNKGETLDDIRRAVTLIRGAGLSLGACFVIGLPGDNLRRHRNSLALAAELKPDYVFWNMYVPWPGTDAGDWFAANGRIGDVKNFSTLMESDASFATPPAETSDFTAEERVKAWVMANLECGVFAANPRVLARLARFVWRFGLFDSFGRFLARKARRLF